MFIVQEAYPIRPDKGGNHYLGLISLESVDC